MNETANENTCGTGCVCCGKGPAVSHMLRMMLPSEAANEHFRKGALELLMGFRELLDQRIQTMSGKPTRGTTVNVE